MSDETIPPHEDPHAARHRRRTIDHVSPKRILISLLMSMPITGPGVYQGGKFVLDVHEQWIEFKKMPARIVELEKTAAEHDELVKRIQSLERYRCILGYDPGGELGKATILPRDRRSECRVGYGEMLGQLGAPAPAAPAAADAATPDRRPQ